MQVIRSLHAPYRLSRSVNSRCTRNRCKLLHVEQLEHRITLDGTDPLSVLLQSPDVNNRVTVQFNRPVTGVDLTDFQLARDGALVDFTSAQLESLSNQDYVLTLPDLFEDGQYSLATFG